MSVQALGAVLDYSESTKGARLTAISLANHADKNGLCFPSMRLVAKEAKLSKRAVKNGIDTLRGDLGELAILVPAEGKTHRPPLYWVRLPGLSGEYEDDHPYFVAFEIDPENVTYPGADSAPGGVKDLPRDPVQDLHPPGEAGYTPPGASNDTPPNREPSKEPSGNPDDEQPSPGRLSNLLADLIAKNDPNGVRPTVGKGWLEAERLMLERDERDQDVAERLIRWSQGDSFWKSNIRSLPKFREKFGQLFLQESRAAIAGTGRVADEHPADRRVRERRGDEVIDVDAVEESP